jgi:tripartite-type tricarboxylate transporter receptor subunit TctC
VAHANEVFRPTDDEIAQARRVSPRPTRPRRAASAPTPSTARWSTRRSCCARARCSPPRGEWGSTEDSPAPRRSFAPTRTAFRQETRTHVHAIPFRRRACIAVAALCALGAPLAQAQGYPSKPITIVVPYAPGGSNDNFARVLGKGLSAALKQPVIVDNKPGASGNMGTAFVAKAPADGYTLLVVSSSLVTNAAIQTKLPFDAVKDLAPVAMIAKGPFIVAVNNDFPAKTPKELVSVLKAAPGKYAYASSGIASTNQFATEQLKALSGTFVLHVPYKGIGPAVTDLIGNQVQLLISSGPSIMPFVKGGRMRAIAVTSAEPSPIAPELPPMASAVPGYNFEAWWGLLAPAGTPPEIVAGLNSEVNKVLASPEFKEFLLKEGALPAPMTPAQFAATIAADIPRWKKLAKQQNIVPE